MKKTSRIAILGGGVGGLVCASELNHRAGSKAEITVFDRSDYHTYQPAFLHLALGERKLDKIRRPLEKLKKQGINFLSGDIFRVDQENMIINAEHGDFEFDYMVISLGTQLDPGAIKGFEDNALNLYTADGAARIKEALAKFESGKIAIVVSSMPYKCPAAPYEMAFLINSYLKKKKRRKNVEISILTPEPQPMPVAGAAIGQSLVNMLEAQDIEYLPKQKITSIGEKQIVLEKKRVKADLIIGVPPHSCPEVIKDAGMTGKSGWLEVDRHTLKTRHENIYAIGDNTHIGLANGKALPKAGVFAKSQAQVVGVNLASELGRSSITKKKFKGDGGCFVETGGKKAAMGKGGFFHEPDPSVVLKRPSRINYMMKMLYEKYWMRAWI